MPILRGTDTDFPFSHIYLQLLCAFAANFFCLFFLPGFIFLLCLFFFRNMSFSSLFSCFLFHGLFYSRYLCFVSHFNAGLSLICHNIQCLAFAKGIHASWTLSLSLILQPQTSMCFSGILCGRLEQRCIYRRSK